MLGGMNDIAVDDEFLWLEDVEGEAAIAWVETQNARTEARLRDDRFEADRARFQAIFDSDDRIPGIVRRGVHVYNFWTNAAHKRGVWRRATMASYRTNQPDWEVLLDLDALGAEEGISWVWGGSSWLPGDQRRVLISLSRGGADAVTVREFDLAAREFVEDGFVVPEAKGGASWVDADMLLVTSAHGGDVTASGYARTIRRWPRGTVLDQAPAVFELQKNDVYGYASIDHDAAYPHRLYGRVIEFFRTEYFYESPYRTRQKLDLPEHCEAETGHGRLLVRPRSDWTVGSMTWQAGSLLAIGIEAFLDGARDFALVFQPEARVSLGAWLNFDGHIVLAVLDNVRSRILIADAADWRHHPVPGLPEAGSVHVQKLAPDDPRATEYLLWVSSFLEPDRLMLGRRDAVPETLKTLKPVFDPKGHKVEQYQAIATDGTAIPYFWVGPDRMAPEDGSGGWPTHLYGYGGFEVSLQPHYMAENGAVWLARGGASVVANIRGGGEFGPAWHKAGIREGKGKAQDDFAAVAADLVQRGLSTPTRILGAGGSNGGLLVGNMLTRHPERFGAILCTVPLLDMKRYTKLLAGASWIAEYGDPDKAEDWAYLEGYSPYHLLRPDQDYPPVFFMTTRRDDRVHPGHARKMAAKMQAMGYDALYYEQLEGGHGAGADSAQRAFITALFESFHRLTLGIG
jgi:prolyl oligopeptidase